MVVWWQMLLPVVDGKTTRSITFSSEVLNRTSSQTCGRCYLPTFLLRDGSLTLMYRAFFIVLIWFKSSLPTMWKLLMVTLWPVMLLWSYMGGGFQMFLEPFTKSSWGLSNIFLITIHPVTLVSVDDSTLLLDWIFVFGSHQEVLDGGASFKVHLYPKPSANVLDALTKSTVVWHNYIGLLLVVCTGSVCSNLFIVLLLCSHLYPVESPCGVLAIS